MPERDTGAAPAERAVAPERSGPAATAAVSALGAGVSDRLLFLQRTAGNRSVARQVLARDEIRFTNTDLQAVYDRNKPGGAKQLAAMRLLDTTVSGVWPRITWAELVRGTAARIYHPELINQGPLGTCGPASVLNFLATIDPEAYVNLVIEVYRDGKAKGKRVNSTIKGFTPKDGTEAGDWMMMSAIQDITNDWYEYYGAPDSDYPSGSAKREGFIPDDLKYALKKFAGVVQTDYIRTEKYEEVLPATRRMNGLVEKPGVFIDIHVGADVLQAPTSVPNEENHVIRLLKPVRITENADDAKSVVELSAFTWGQVWPWKGTVNQFIHMVWGYTVGSVTKGVI